MKKLFFNTFGYIAQLVPLNIWTTLTNIRIIYPFYHTIQPNVPEMFTALYTPITLKRFIKDIEYFTKHFEPINPYYLKEFITNGKVKNKPFFLLTFDDGLREVYDHAFPILKKYNIQPILFVNTDFVDNKALFYRYKISLIIHAIQKQPSLCQLIKVLLNDFTNISNDSIATRLLQLTSAHTELIDRMLLICEIDEKEFLNKHQPYLTWNELQFLSSEGWYIGSHGTNHEAFQNLTFEEKIQQLTTSFQIIDEHVSQPYHYFAFPFTDHLIDKELINYIITNRIADLIFGGAGLKNEYQPFHIQRIPIEKDYCLSAKHAISSEYFYYFVKKIVRKNYTKR